MRVLSSGVGASRASVIVGLAAAAREPLDAALTGTETILLVEDEAMMRDLLRVALEQFGYNVISAADGEDALDAAASYGAPVHLVLSDVIMPRLDGCTLITEMRRWFPGIGVLLMSGFERGGQAAQLIDDDLAFFIQKPFSIHALAAAVRSAIEWRPNHRPE